MANKCFTKCLTCLGIRKIKIKTALKFPFHPSLNGLSENMGLEMAQHLRALAAAPAQDSLHTHLVVYNPL